MKDRKIIIAIDGFSACGKSTLAKSLAKRLHYRYIDTGAMYRALTFYLLTNHIPIDDIEAIANVLPHIHITFEYDNKTGRQITLLDAQHVESEIRSREVSDKVSLVSAISEVRHFLVRQQKRLGLNRGVVMDGRDIGTVVFPDAEIKIFMTAGEDVRISRRYEELLQAGTSLSYEEVRKNIIKRDFIDTHRLDSPLAQADDAIELDNTWLSLQEQEDLVFDWVINTIHELPKVES